MTENEGTVEQEQKRRKVIYRHTANTPVYGLGFLGALVYYIQHADTIWIGLLGVLKAIFWPGMLVYELLMYLEM